MIGDSFHTHVGEGDCFVGIKVETNFIECILEASQTETHGAVTQVRAACIVGRVVIHIDDVIEHAHCDGHYTRHGVANECSILDEFRHIDGAEVTDRSFISRRVKRYFSAEIAGVYDTDVILRRANIARVLPRYPRVTCFKKHSEVLPP